MKSLNAIKCKDGYHVTISQTLNVIDESDVKALIDMNGLKIRQEFSDEKRIYAE